MLARIRFVFWTVFVVSLVTAFWQYFEFTYMLADNGLIESPIWSSTLGSPWVHHGYIGFVGAGASIAVMQGLRWRSDRRKGKAHR